jgi:UDPglucose 6-dehydrogenase
VTAVGWIGLGKLGAPCAAALRYHGGHVVYGYDVRGVDPDAYDWDSLPAVELADSVAKIVDETDGVVFVSVQTPHPPAYGGETPTPLEPREFEYGYLVNAVHEVCVAARELRRHVTLTIVSTVLPGTFNRYLRPLLNEYVTPVYHPFLIAMGTVVEDFVTPELTLLGVDRPGDEEAVLGLYRVMHSAPAPVTSIESAELAKVAYNTFITSKIVFANALMELAEATGADVDEVTDALALATQRVVSPRYLRAGMGDGGACHPRDNVALSTVARRYDLSVDYFGFLVRAREDQTRYLADVVERWRALTLLPVALLGKTYKPGVSSTAGSPALLLAGYLAGRDVALRHFDPVLERSRGNLLDYPHVYFIATRHPDFAAYAYPAGSVVIDPFGYVDAQPGVTLVTPGRKRGTRRSTNGT